MWSLIVAGVKRYRWVVVAGLVAVCGSGFAACATGPTSAISSQSGKISVVAAENVWGSVASQVGGIKVAVTSLITNPTTDPHSYEPTASDARTVAMAQVVIVNGIGYDPWASQLVAADDSSRTTVLNVGDLVGIPVGGNPHRWYDPANVTQVATQMASDYSRIDPHDSTYFHQQLEHFLTVSLAQYHQLIAQIRARFAGVPVGASESIFTPLAQALGLDLKTPESFLDAISEGNDPTAADKSTIDNQISGKQIAIYVFNTQNATPDVQTQVNAARAEGIPVATVTETLAPANATFQQWQVSELEGMQSALAKATGR